MKIIFIDDDKRKLKNLTSLCREMPGISEVSGFTNVKKALQKLDGEEGSDAVLLDIDMQKTDDEKLRKLIGSSAENKTYSEHNITIKTFGEFEIYVDGIPVSFKRSKAKELLAYLVDRQGRSISRASVFSALWEGKVYDRGMQKQMDVIIRSLRDTLREYGIGELFRLERGMLSLRNEMIDCDLYDFLEGDMRVADNYRGEYMNSYTWANLTEGYITNLLKKKIAEEN